MASRLILGSVSDGVEMNHKKTWLTQIKPFFNILQAVLTVSNGKTGKSCN